MQRKPFRIEQLIAQAEPPVPASGSRHDDLLNEIKSLRAMIAPPAQTGDARRLREELEIIYDTIARSTRELSVLAGYGTDGARVARAAQELDAVVGGTEKATQRILKAAEDIEDLAKTLAAGAKTDHERGLAQEVQDQVTNIFEACNFHDLIGQRVSKATSALRFVETQVVHLLDMWSSIDQGVEISPGEQRRAGRLVNGPKLDGDSGHATQDEIDSMFAGRVSAA